MIASTPLNIVVIGAGLIGPRHAKHVNRNPNTDLFAIIDPLPAAKDVAEQLQTLYFPSIDAMVQYARSEGVPLPDGAIVCTPNHTHVKISAELAVHGIHLLVEKPLSADVTESKALKMFAEQQNVKILVGHHRRFNPFIVEAKRNLHKVGDIIAIQGTWTLRKPENYYTIAPWRTDSKTGGGVLLINLIHDIDLLQYLFGPIEKVYAELLKKQRTEFPNVDEGACLTLKFRSGIAGTFICSDNVVSPFNFEAGTGENPTIPFHEGLEGFYRVFGSKGTLSIPDLTLHHQPGAKTDEENSWLHPIVKEALVENRNETLYNQLPFDLQLDHFVEVIRGKKLPFCDADEGMSALLCIEAVMKSIETDIPQFVVSVDDIEPNYESLGIKNRN